MQVSLDFKVKEKVMKLRDEPVESMFDEAQSKIYTLMHRDSFPRYDKVSILFFLFSVAVFQIPNFNLLQKSTPQA